MRIEREHRVGQEEAKQRIDGFIDHWIARNDFPGGIKIVNPARQWSGNRMDYSVTAKKGLLRTTLKGEVAVSEERVILDFHVPGVIAKLVGEDAIRSAVEQQLTELFPAVG